MKYNNNDTFIWRVTTLVAARPLLEPHKFKGNENRYVIHLLTYIREYQLNLVEQFNKELCG